MLSAQSALRPVFLVIAVAVALALPASALAGGFSSTLKIGSHEPKVGAQPITVTATHGSQKLSGTVHFQFVYQGTVVSTQPGGKLSRGVYRTKLLWPARAVGHSITLRVVVQTRYGTDDLNWWIRVR
jgi:hypothetical protein